jgi:hypothetical protein
MASKAMCAHFERAVIVWYFFAASRTVIINPVRAIGDWRVG